MANVIEERGRITARLPQNLVEKIQEAADLTGATLNQFLVQSALEKAAEVIDRETTIRYSREDAAMLINLLEAPPKRNEAFTRAFERYRNRMKDVPPSSRTTEQEP